MLRFKEQYQVKGYDLFDIRNRNERRVASFLQELLNSMIDEDFEKEVVMDVYALALNNLPARYAQSGSIVLRDPVRQEDIEKAVREALDQVLINPKEGL